MVHYICAHVYGEPPIPIRAQKSLQDTAAYGPCSMQVWLTTTCPKTLIVTLGNVLESGNAKNRVNLA